MMQDDFDFLPIFSFPTYVSYYCPDGLVTDNFEEAKAHGYGTVGNRSASFGHRDAFETFEHSVLPVITGICMKKVSCCLLVFWMNTVSHFSSSFFKY